MMARILKSCSIAMMVLLSVSMLYGQLKRDRNSNDVRTLIVFFDGLRPDYITQEVMPNLFAFSKAGAYGKNHHSVFPTVTRVNAASYATGSYPATHGLMGNTVYFPQVNAVKGLNTGDYTALRKIAEATEGHLLTATSIGEALDKAGAKMMVFSSGSTGQALLQNHTVKGAVINTDLVLPEPFKQTVIDDIGPIPPDENPNIARHRWVTDALIRYGLTLNGPLVSAVWFSDPDGAAHADGIGAASSVEALKSVDAEFGRILAAIKENNLTENFNIIVSSDHGFITHAGTEGLQDFLIREGLKASKESQDVVVVGNALYVKDHDAAAIKVIVSHLQAQPWVGALFTKAKTPGDSKGIVEGTLSFESIHWNHPERSADILVDAYWDDRKNDRGYAGTSYSRGVAGHGGLSPYEVHIPLLASGPGFKKGFVSDLPTANVDIVPTVLALHNIPAPATMTGRVMTELLASRKGKKMKARKETITASAAFSGCIYTVTLERTLLGRYRYIDFARVRRTGGPEH